MVQRIQLDCCEYPILGNSLIFASVTIAASRVFSITITVLAHFSVCVFYDLFFFTWFTVLFRVSATAGFGVGAAFFSTSYMALVCLNYYVWFVCATHATHL